MNKPFSESDFATPKVTTGPIAGSRKVYSAPEAAPDLRVPYREIALSEGAGEETVRVYDPSGVYTDSDAAIDVEKGLKRTRVEWVKARGLAVVTAIVSERGVCCRAIGRIAAIGRSHINALSAS